MPKNTDWRRDLVKRKTLIIGLFSDRLDVLMCSGAEVSKALRVDLRHIDAGVPWPEFLRQATPPLREAVAELDAGGAIALVFYRNSTACLEYVNLSVGSASAAREAAALNCAESLSCELDAACASAVVVCREKSAGDDHTHLVCTADHDAALAAIASLVASAGLTFEAAIPLDAASHALLCLRALGDTSGTQAFLHIGEHHSAFVIADQGTLRFARSIRLGVESLATALMRPMRTVVEESVELSASEASALLRRVGFPDREAIVDEQRGLTGAQLIPLLQPVLQRFIIELRQSLRFGLAEEQRQAVDLMISGPGSTLPNMAGVIGTELGLKTTSDPRFAGLKWYEPGAEGSELREAMANRRVLAPLDLRPIEVEQQRNMHRLRRWLWAGAAVGVCFLAMDFTQYHSRLTAARRQASTIQSQISDMQMLKTTAEKLAGMKAAMESLETTIHDEAGTLVTVRGILHDLSRTTPASIRLTNVALTRERGETVGRLTGFVLDQDGRTHLETFVDGLKQSPLMKKVVLANVFTSQLNQESAQQFEVTLTAIDLPRQVVPQDSAAAAGGSNDGGPR